MITVSSTIRELLEAKHRQVVRITVGNTGIVLTGDNIAQGGLTLDRYCVSGNSLELGSAIASELNVKLLNFNGEFDNVTFEGQELHLEQGVIDDEDETHWFNMGYFKVDTPPRKKSTINISALDRMTKFDESAYAWSALQTYPMTLANFVSAICSRCTVTLATNLSTLPNYNISIPSDPVSSEEITFRNLIQWASALMGACAYINENGQLVIGWTSNTDVTITGENRYQGADLWENNVTITGYTFTTTVETETEEDITTEDVTYYSGTLDYAIDLTPNPLMPKDGIQGVLNNIYSARGTVTYRPFECSTFPFPYIMPLDKITYVDSNNNEISTIVTNVVHSLNLGSSIASKGDTETTNSFQSGTGFTPSQTKELTKTQFLIEQASVAANSAQQSADSAYNSAVSANNSANNALTQLSIVEDVAGTLRWISEHGDFVHVPDTETSVQPGTIYYIYENGSYVPIVNPDPSKNPYEEGWYVLDVTDSQASYIMAHLAVTDAGLWVLPVNQLAPHQLYDYDSLNDEYHPLEDSDGNLLIDFSKDPQNATGYKVLLGESGMTIFNGEGAAVANYGTTTTIGKETENHVFINTQSVDIKNGSIVYARFSGDGMIIYENNTEIASFAVRPPYNFPVLTLDGRGSIIYANGIQSYADQNTGVYKAKYANTGIYYNDDPFAIGHIWQADEDTYNLSSHLWDYVTQFGLTPGKWLVIFGGEFASSDVGTRAMALGTSPNGISATTRYDITARPCSGFTTKVQSTRILTVTSDTQYYLYAYQNSNNSLDVKPYAFAIKIL